MIDYDNPNPLTPKTPATESPTEQHRLSQQIEDQNRRIAQLETELRRLRNDLRTAVTAFNLTKQSL